MGVERFLKKWIIPQGFLPKIDALKSTILKGYYSKQLFKKNKKFKNIHAGERCFILASGPSIKTQDLSPIYGETCIAVSHFHLHPAIQQLKPKYHVLAAQHKPFNFNDSSKYFKDFAISYKNFKPDIFLGLKPYAFDYLNLLKAHPEFKSDNLYFLDYGNKTQLDEFNYLDENIWDISRNLFTTRTVLYAAVQIAAYMGFKEIYLLGADHDYLNDTSRTTNHHFYAEEKGISDKNHLEQYTSEKWFLEYHLRWKQYRLMAQYCAKKGIKIYNATEGGMLDVFERKSIQNLG